MKVVITDCQYPEVDTERRIITGAGHTLETFQVKNEAELVAATRDADAIIVQYAAMTHAVIEQLENCKIIIKYGIGVNNIDCTAATEHGVYVCNVPDYGTDEVSNHAIALLFALCKKLPQLTKQLEAGEWSYAPAVPLYRMDGATLGLVGFGRIPQLVAKKMVGFGLNIIANDPYISEEAAQAFGVTLVDFDTLCTQSDYISVHCPLTEQTTRLFNAEAFKKMKPTAFLINTARGGILDEQALIKALNSREIAGAGLDVFEQEPPNKDNPLLVMQNVVATPHTAWYSEQAIEALQKKVAEEVVNVLAGNRPWNLCNREVINEAFTK